MSSGDDDARLREWRGVSLCKVLGSASIRSKGWHCTSAGSCRRRSTHALPPSVVVLGEVVLVLRLAGRQAPSSLVRRCSLASLLSAWIAVVRLLAGRLRKSSLIDECQRVAVLMME